MYPSPTILAIVASLGTDPTLQHMDPYDASNVGTEALKTCCIVLVSHTLAVLAHIPWWSHTPPVLDWHPPIHWGWWQTNSCHALLRFFCLAILHIANDGPDPVNTAHLMNPAYHPVVIYHHSSSIIAHFPMLQQNAQTQQHNLITQRLGVISHQQHLHLDEAHHEREAAKTKSITLVGKERFPILLHLLCLHTEQDIVAACPVYRAQTNVGKSARMWTLKNALVAELVQYNNPYLCITLSPAIVETLLSCSGTICIQTPKRPVSLVGNVILLCPVGSDADRTDTFRLVMDMSVTSDKP